MSTLKKVKKDIPRITFMLVVANKKVFSKNQTFLSLFWIKNLAIIIS